MSSMVRKLQSDAVLSNPAVLFNFATTAVGLTQVDRSGSSCSARR